MRQAVLLLLAGASACGAPRARGWTVELGAFGPVRFGMTIAEASDALGDPLRATQDELNGCTFMESRALPAGTSLMVREGRVERVDVDSATVKTAEGAAVGMAESTVIRLYTNRLQVTDHPYPPPGAHYLIHTPRAPADSAFALIFETDGEVITRFRAGRAEAVRLIEGCS